jgi:uracil-DNA glycosylase family 4
MGDDEALAELQFLTRSLRAHAEWQITTGATGLARAAVAAPIAPEPSVPRASAPADAASRELAPRVLLAEAAGVAASSSLSVPERRQRLQALGEEVRPCTRCGLCERRTQTVFARGDGSSGVCFIGEGPGADEDAQGLPFVGKAGQLLDRMIEAMGLSRDEVYVCNIVKCRPPDNRKPEPEEMAACMPYLNEQLDLVEPQVIVALGATAVQGLFGTTEGITRMRGRWKTLRGRIPVMPTFHPAYLLRTPAAKREVWEDLQEVLRKLGRTPPARR